MIRAEPLTATGLAVYERFRIDPSLNAIAVVDDKSRPVGVLLRSTFMLRFADRFGRALYKKRPAHLLMDQALVVPVGAHANDLGPLFIANGRSGALEGFVVVDDEGRYVGIGDGLGIVRLLTEFRESEIRRSFALNAELERLLQRQIDRQRDVSGYYCDVTRAVCRAIGADRVSLWMFTADQSAIVCADLFDEQAGHSSGMRLEASAYPSYFRALVAARVIDADDARTDPRTQEFGPTYLDPLGIASLLDAQIRVGDGVRGVICCESRRLRRWTHEEIGFVGSVAERVGLALCAEELALERDALETRVRMRTLDLEAARIQAEAANAAKSRFIASISHELRTPLNAILGYSELLIEEGEADASMTKDLRRIRSAGQRLLRLVNEVLDFAKFEAERMEVELESLDVRELIDEVLITVAPQAEANGNVIDVFVEPDVSTMTTDGFKLGQCLINLAANAAKFTRDGRIRIVCARGVRDGRACLLFRVIDTGIGIAPEQMARLFEAFVQADCKISRQYGGTGLGLALTGKMARLLGGDVEGASEPGRGSTFTLAIPVEPPALAKAA
jgi:signal transduction histidine kinase